TPLPAVPPGFEKQNTASGIYKNQIAREFYMTLTNLPEGGDIGVKTEIVDSIGQSGGPGRKDGQLRLAISATLPDRLKSTDIRVGVASGDWKTLTTGTRGSGVISDQVTSTDDGRYQVIFSPPAQDGN